MFIKFLLTVAVIAIVWFGFQFAQRVAADRARHERGGRKAGPGPVSRPDADGESVQDLIKCPACSTWRSAKLGSCGRVDCPY